MTKVNELYTTTEAASELRCTRRAVYNHIKAGRLKAYKPGGRLLIPREAIDEFLNRGVTTK